MYLSTNISTFHFSYHLQIGIFHYPIKKFESLFILNNPKKYQSISIKIEFFVMPEIYKIGCNDVIKKWCICNISKLKHKFVHTFTCHTYDISNDNEKHLKHYVNNYQKWRGKVIGNDEQIIKALHELGREPNNAKELEQVILKNSSKMLQKTLQEAFDEEPLHKSNL